MSLRIDKWEREKDLENKKLDMIELDWKASHYYDYFHNRKIERKLTFCKAYTIITITLATLIIANEALGNPLLTYLTK
jgi:hypothetical protein